MLGYLFLAVAFCGFALIAWGAYQSTKFEIETDQKRLKIMIYRFVFLLVAFAALISWAGIQISKI